MGVTMSRRNLGLLIVLLSIGIIVWLTRERESKVAKKSAPAQQEQHEATSALVPAEQGKDSSKLQYAMELSQKGGSEAEEKLVRAYGEWASDPGAVEARKVALAALLNEPQLAKKLSNVLKAVDASKVPPERDPLWSPLVESIATLWTGENLNRGRDLAMSENRDNPHRLLVDSLIELGEADRLAQLSASQRTSLLHDLIDLYHDPRTEPATKPHIESTVRVLGGDDVASILAGADVGKNSKHPAIVDYERQLTEAERQLLPNHKKPKQ